MDALGLPADKNAEGGVDLGGVHLLAFKAKPAAKGALPVAGGKFPRGRKHAKRVGIEVTIPNPTFHDGAGANTIYVDSTKVTRLLVPATQNPASLPGPPGAGLVDHYKCYGVKASKTAVGTLQDARGKERKNLQVVVEDQFGDGQGHPSYGDARLYDLKKVKELCMPVAKTNIDPLDQDAKGATRTTSCWVTPAAVSEPNVALLCWQAKAASKAYAQPWDGVDKGTKVTPKQAKPTTRTVFVGHQLVAPERVDTSKESQFCFPVRVTGPGTVAPRQAAKEWLARLGRWSAAPACSVRRAALTRRTPWRYSTLPWRPLPPAKRAAPWRASSSTAMRG